MRERYPDPEKLSILGANTLCGLIEELVPRGAYLIWEDPEYYGKKGLLHIMQSYYYLDPITLNDYDFIIDAYHETARGGVTVEDPFEVTLWFEDTANDRDYYYSFIKDKKGNYKLAADNEDECNDSVVCTLIRLLESSELRDDLNPEDFEGPNEEYEALGKPLPPFRKRNLD